MIRVVLKPCAQARADKRRFSASRSADDGHETAPADLRFEHIEFFVAAKKIIAVAIGERPGTYERPIATCGCLRGHALPPTQTSPKPIFLTAYFGNNMINVGLSWGIPISPTSKLIMSRIVEHKGRQVDAAVMNSNEVLPAID
jgi:hypothetical protein